MVARVLVEIASQAVDKTFDYLVPSSLENVIQVGIRVLVPFGNRQIEGFVLELANTSSYDLKEIIACVDTDIVLNKELLLLGKKLQRYTLSTLISCYQVMLPKALKARHEKHLSKKTMKMISLCASYDLSSCNEKQKEIVSFVQAHGSVSLQDMPFSKSRIETLVKKNILQIEEQEVYRLQRKYQKADGFALTEEQQEIVDTVLRKEGYVPYLLYGVTGSGKTEVYMALVDAMLEQGKQAIVLVPEISLTPQMVDRFQSRFGDLVAVLHSRLSEGEKYDEWRRIARGEVSIVIGARSAIFAPLTHLGIIIIDEEHTDSYHQENNPRYTASTVALWRGAYHHCPVLLGSATPRLESYARASKQVFQLLTLPNRVFHRPLPKVEIVDLSLDKKRRFFNFSTVLVDKMQKVLAHDEQIILLLNRRGYASFVSCRNCGYTKKCPNCDISLTYHKSSGMLRCHYCGYAEKKSDTCPHCHEPSLQFLGQGTEQIEENLHQLFPGKKVLRMDVDTTSRKGSHEKMLSSFRNHQYDILVGTQMVAKGLDFPNVTLVGVINADTSLNIPDFRSSEVTFQLLDQVAGRAGRGEKPGEVVIQTFNPTHYSLIYAKNHDYLGFYHHEMQIRKALKYSPYYYMVLLRISSVDLSFLKQETQKMKEHLYRRLEQTIILGPTPAYLYKVNQTYRYQIILKYKKEAMLYPALEELLTHYKTSSKLKIDVDFDPRHF